MLDSFYHMTLKLLKHLLFLFVFCFTYQSTAMGMLGQSVHLATLFSWASLIKQLISTGVASLISARFHTLVDIDHEMISTVYLLPSTE